jgi:type I restriction enzyme S subunit
MEWKEYQIQDVCRLINGRAYSNDEMLEYGKYKIVRVGNLSGGNSTWFYSDLELPADKYCHNGDLLFAWACTFGPHIWKEDNTIFHYHIWKIVEDKDVVDRRFFYYYLKFATGGFLGALNGSVMVHITKSSMEKMSIRIPKKLEDQRRIASILSSLDRKIELNNKINADLEEMAQAIFKNWFVDFEPFKDGRFVDSELGMIPEGWKVGSPYEYAKVVYGAPYKSAKFNDNGEGLPLIRIRDLKDCNPQFYTPEILPQTEYVNMGDIVAGMDAEFVPHIWKGNTGLLNQRVCKLMPQQTSISNLFVLYLMKPELEFVQSYKTGTTVSHLGKADIDKFVVVLPPLEVVEECSKILDSILQRIKNISAESRTLSTLRDTLLPRLMSGEIEIPE